ncbi:unnamed protein product [Somion occarium]|uniref:Fungal-type protein kinase domain-containing protein n=1 Tax=Somion occarium TaxID=3059160 RepID=A0ABP1E592_9APHY
MDTSIYQEDLDKWFSKFLPGKDGENLSFEPEDLPEEFREKKFHFDEVTFDANSGHPRIQLEKDLYPILCPVIQNVFDLAAHRSTGEAPRDLLKIRDTSLWEEESDNKLSPDFLVHKDSVSRPFELDDARKKTVTPKSHRKFVGRTAYSWSLLPGEAKIKDDGFGLGDKLNLPDTDAGRQTRGQFAEYISEILARQHRQFTFAFYIYKNWARFFIVDRVASVTTPAFDYVKDPYTFLKFFYRLAQADASAQGYDPTVTLASSTSISILKDHMSTDHGVIQPFIDDAMNDAFAYESTSIWPFYEVQVRDHATGNISYFLIGKPRTPSTSLLGRATKGYVAFDLIAHDFVWLKDTWRLASLHSHPEWEVYDKLNKAGVQHIATMRTGGDVYDPKLQRTLSQEYLSHARLKPRIHCRLVINEIGCPLETYRTSRDLIYIVLCAFQAHEDAWVKAGTLHRDISDNNVLIFFVNGRKRGLLIDWDLCKYASELQERKATHRNRSGTWQFICAVRLQYPKKYCEVADDIESFVHLINWCALRYHHHKGVKSQSGFATFVHRMFLDCTTSSDGLLYGCDEKWAAMMRGDPGFKLTSDERFQDVINQLMRLCNSHYRCFDLEELQRFQPADAKEADESSHVSTTEDPDVEAPTDIDILRSPFEPTTQVDHTKADVAAGIAATDIQRGPAMRTLDEHLHVARVLFAAAQDPNWNCKRDPKVDYFEQLLDVNLTLGRRSVAGTRSVSTSSQKRPPPVSGSMQLKRSRGSRSNANASQLASWPEEEDGEDEEGEQQDQDQGGCTQLQSQQSYRDVEEDDSNWKVEAEIMAIRNARRDNVIDWKDFDDTELE